MRTLSLASPLFLLALVSSVQAAAPYPVGKYTIDPAHSSVSFEIPHLKISSVEGRFKEYDGELALAEKLKDSKVTANIKTASIDTDSAKRDEHLRSPDFFDAAKFPAITFVSENFEGSAEKLKINGNLTIHGVTKKVKLDGKYLGAVKDGYGNQKVAFNASTKISRKEFGLTWNSLVEAGPVVGDEVTITLKIQAAQVTPEKK